MTVLSLPSRTHATVAVRRHVRRRPAADLSRMTRYRGGTYSHTVDTVVFFDGTSARTDLIRLNPNVEAYSLDFAGIAPTKPSRYRLETWSAVPNLRGRSYEAEVHWILSNSYPMLQTDELSRRLRDAGYPLGPANISEHEAIAGTQAAIWYLTNGLALDNRPLNVPIRQIRQPGSVTFEFDGEPQLGGYSVGLKCDARATLTLEKSVDGTTWQVVSGSRLTVEAGEGHYTTTLGVGSTVSASRHGRAGRGYRFYRLGGDGDRKRYRRHLRYQLLAQRFSALSQRRPHRAPVQLPAVWGTTGTSGDGRTAAGFDRRDRRIRTGRAVPIADLQHDRGDRGRGAHDHRR